MTLHLALPKGRMQDGVFQLLRDAGIRVRLGARGYRPTVSLAGVEAKLLKPQSIVEMLDRGTRDLGFAGADWVAEKRADLVCLLDTELDPVRIVAAAPNGRAWPPGRPFVVASEYEQLTLDWLTRTGRDATFLRSYGATEVLPPEDADCIVDNTATGATLEANNLTIVDELMRSSTRMYASKQAMDDPGKRQQISEITLVLKSVITARSRVMLEVNVSSETLEAIVGILPCMREPTIAKLFGDAGYAVKAAVPRKDLPVLVPRIRAAGGTDIVVTALSQIVA